MQRLALGCSRPSQALPSIVQCAFSHGIKTYDTVFLPQVASTLNQLTTSTSTTSGTQAKTRIFLKTTETEKDALEFQARSFANAAGKHIDLFMLTLDPEFEHVTQQQQQPSPTPRSVETKLAGIFEIFEKFTNQGLITGYGVSSNGLTSGQLVPQAVMAANPGKGLKIIQFPGNLLERTGLTGAPSLWAYEKNYETSVNRPFTAFDNEGSWRFVEAPFPMQYSEAKDLLLAHISPPPGASPEEMEACSWMSNLILRVDEQLSQFTSVVHWESELGERILPMIDREVEELDSKTLELLSNYFHQFGLAVRESGGQQARERVYQKHPELKSSSRFNENPLQQSALEFALSFPHVKTVRAHASDPSQIEAWSKWDLQNKVVF